jgi:hypothetical protein
VSALCTVALLRGYSQWSLGGTGATTRQTERGEQEWRGVRGDERGEREQGPEGAGIDKVVTNGMEARRRPAADDRLAVR